MTTQEEVGAVAAERQAGLWSDAWARLRANKVAVVGIWLLVFIVALALIGPFLTPYDFLSQSVEGRNAGPSMLHWLGTDDLGRDVLSRIVYGARTALFIAVVVTAISSVAGALLGAIAGFNGGLLDKAIMWFADVTMSIPGLLLVIVVNTSLSPPLAAWMDDMYRATGDAVYRNTALIDFVLVFGAMALISWPPYCRLVRGQVLTIRNSNYVTAAHAIGLSSGAIIRRYVLPNALGPFIVAVSAGLGSAMVLESAFSFLGVGVRPPMPSWGNMIADGLRVWRSFPHLLAAPAIVLAIATIAFSFVGDGLNDALNPKGRK